MATNFEWDYRRSTKRKQKPDREKFGNTTKGDKMSDRDGPQETNPGKKTNSSSSYDYGHIYNYRIPGFEYCTEPSTSGGWRETFFCNRVIP